MKTLYKREKGQLDLTVVIYTLNKEENVRTTHIWGSDVYSSVTVEQLQAMIIAQENLHLDSDITVEYIGVI